MINKNSKVIINNKTYNVKEFMKKYAVQDESTALMILNKLVAQGKATIKDESTKEEKLIQDAISNCTATESIYNLLQGQPNGTHVKKNSDDKK